MTHEDSIRMAHEAGEDIIRIAHAVGLCDEVGGIEGDTGSYYSYTEEIISLFLAAFKAGADTERAECAKLCESEWSNVAEKMYGQEIAAAIRAKGTP